MFAYTNYSSLAIGSYNRYGWNGVHEWYYTLFCMTWLQSSNILNIYLEHSLLIQSARPALGTVEPLFHGETASVGFKSLHQQIVDSSKMIVAFVLERLQ